MDKTVKLMHDISKTEGHTAQIENDAEVIDKELVDIRNNLGESEKVNKSLHTLDSSLTTASQLLAIVGIIPQISTEASTLQRTIDTFHKTIKVAVKHSDSVERIVKPVRDKIGKIEPKIEKMDKVLLATMNHENQFIDILGSAQHCISSLAASDAKIKLEEQMESASSNIDPIVLKFDNLQVGFLQSIEEAKKRSDQIKSWAQGLIELNLQVNKVIDVLSPLKNTLQLIAGAFKRTIRVPYGGYPKICKKWGAPYPCGWHTVYFSFSIKQILDGVNSVIKPVMDLLNKAMYEVLNPLLRKLNLNIKLPEIPGLDVLKDLEESLQDRFGKIVGTFDDLFIKLEVFTDFSGQIQRILDEISEINKSCRLNIEK